MKPLRQPLPPALSLPVLPLPLLQLLRRPRGLPDGERGGEFGQVPFQQSTSLRMCE
jgi:hypothetical protein